VSGTGKYPNGWSGIANSIRDRDNHRCVACGCSQSSKTFPVHHIDGDCSNCSEDNLVTLCPGCHTKVHKEDEYAGYITLVARQYVKLLAL